MSITLNDVGDYFPYREERVARPIRAPWEKDDTHAVRAFIDNTKRQAIRDGSFTSASLMQHLEDLIA